VCRKAGATATAVRALARAVFFPTREWPECAQTGRGVPVAPPAWRSGTAGALLHACRARKRAALLLLTVCSRAAHERLRSPEHNVRVRVCVCACVTLASCNTAAALFFRTLPHHRLVAPAAGDGLYQKKRRRWRCADPTRDCTRLLYRRYQRWIFRHARAGSAAWSNRRICFSLLARGAVLFDRLFCSFLCVELRTTAWRWAGERVRMSAGAGRGRPAGVVCVSPCEGGH
jgi:hypothetical protein